MHSPPGRRSSGRKLPITTGFRPTRWSSMRMGSVTALVVLDNVVRGLVPEKRPRGLPGGRVRAQRNNRRSKDTLHQVLSYNTRADGTACVPSALVRYGPIITAHLCLRKNTCMAMLFIKEFLGHLFWFHYVERRKIHPKEEHLLTLAGASSRLGKTGRGILLLVPARFFDASASTALPERLTGKPHLSGEPLARRGTRG